jgi:hypothetical protein
LGPISPSGERWKSDLILTVGAYHELAQPQVTFGKRLASVQARAPRDFSPI